MKNLVWNVYYHNWNKDKLEQFNIFEHGRFREDIEKICIEFKRSEQSQAELPLQIEKFAERLRRELSYYFWAKCEWEVVITKKDDRVIMTPWVGRTEIELDVTNDKDFDWLRFHGKMIEKYINKDNGVKIDVYEQVRFYWDDFVQYCWDNR